MIRTAIIIACHLPLWAVAQPVVPGFDRFPNDTPAAQIAGGEVLINELNCIACHTADKEQRQRFESYPAPVLFTAHNPAPAGWLKRWLSAPHNLKHGTIMPNLLHGLNQNDKAHTIESLRHYLLSLTPPMVNLTIFNGNANAGKNFIRTLVASNATRPMPKITVKIYPWVNYSKNIRQFS